MSAGRSLRCAIYTRKSTEEGLEQAFNTLDAQYEACKAYILSQAGEGWIHLPARYDDGGYSGGNMERPALRRLLADIGNGLVDTVVVYKIDRLTRSLADFAKMVECFDERSVSFVSVTQAFNTTTSMGRLTLNVLLSFAQFEREVGAERVRDKVAASRKKGIWMGGCPPLGYDIGDRKLIINPAEAETIRWIFSRYLDVRSIARLRGELEASGIKTKIYVSRAGRTLGGVRWWVGALRHLLRNRVYVGEAMHKGASYPGEHEAILDRGLFQAVQGALDTSRVARREGIIRRSPGLLTGLVFDDAGNRMSPQATHKGPRRRYVYYVSQAVLQRQGVRGSLSRVSAPRIDDLVTGAARRFEQVLAGRSSEPALSSPQTDDDVRTLTRTYVRKVIVGAARVVLEFKTDASTRITNRLHKDLVRAFSISEVASVDGGWRVTTPVDLARSSTARSITAPLSEPWTAR